MFVPFVKLIASIGEGFRWLLLILFTKPSLDALEDIKEGNVNLTINIFIGTISILCFGLLLNYFASS